MVWGSQHDKTIKQPFLRGECAWKEVILEHAHDKPSTP
jgi:hypothetical protein